MDSGCLLLLADLSEQAFVDSQLLEAHVAALRSFPLSDGAHRKRATAHKTRAAADIACLASEIGTGALSLFDLEDLSMLDFLPLLEGLLVVCLLPSSISFVNADDHFDVFSIVLHFKVPQFLFFLHLFVQFFLDINISLS